MAGQKEAEKMLRKSLKGEKKGQNLFWVVEIVLLVGVVVLTTAMVVYGQTARPDNPQIDASDVANKCVRCMNTTVAEDCNFCITETMDAIDYDSKVRRYENISDMLLLLLIMFYILILWIECFGRKDSKIEQLKIEHALEIDNLKKRRK